MEQQPKVGVGVIVTSKNHPGCVVVGRRKNVTGDGKYSLPGGHLEYREQWDACAQRETLEETGLHLTNVQYAWVTDGQWSDKHYVTIYMQGETEEEPKNLEPNKCHGWEWMKWDALPEDNELFLPLALIRQQGYNPFDGSLQSKNGDRTNLPPAQEATANVSHDASLRPKVGVGVFITSANHPGCVLIGRRKSKSLGYSKYALPGGHLEFQESWFDCARRETTEETALVLTGLQFVGVVNTLLEKAHYIDLFVQAETTNSDELQNVEPESCEGWEWRDWNNFPGTEEMFEPLAIIRSQGFNPFS